MKSFQPVLIDFLKGQDHPAVQRFLGAIDREIPFGISPVIFLEVLQGAATEKDFRLVKEYLGSRPLYDLRDGRESFARAVKKERKAYFYDWGRALDPGRRFENYVAVELKTTTDLWHDRGIGDFDLMYIRTKDGKETDFLILRNGLPWCLLEAKLQDEGIARHHFDQSNALGRIPFLQVTAQDEVYKKQDSRFFRISASRLFA